MDAAGKIVGVHANLSSGRLRKRLHCALGIDARAAFATELSPEACARVVSVHVRILPSRIELRCLETSRVHWVDGNARICKRLGGVSNLVSVIRGPGERIASKIRRRRNPVWKGLREPEQ